MSRPTRCASRRAAASITSRRCSAAASGSRSARSTRPTSACGSSPGIDGSVTELFARALDHVDPTYGATFATPWGGIASLSPELFLRREGRDVTTAPIKGTVRRPRDERRAREALAALRGSTKDAAEHVMIVDLMRNDLDGCPSTAAWSAPRLPDAEAHPGLWHLVTRVRGRLRRASATASCCARRSRPARSPAPPRCRRCG